MTYDYIEPQDPGYLQWEFLYGVWRAQFSVCTASDALRVARCIQKYRRLGQ